MKRTEQQNAARLWLLEARGAEKRVRQLEILKARAYGQETAAVSGASASGVRAGGIRRKGERFAVLSDELDREIGTLQDMRGERLAAIGEIRDHVLAAVLIGYYLNGRSWEEIAGEVHYCRSYVRNDLHGRALSALADVREKHSAK